jgi:protein TonB
MPFSPTRIGRLFIYIYGMKIHLTLFILLFVINAAKAQEKTVTKDVRFVVTLTESPSSYPGGQKKFRQYLNENLRYPEAAKQAGIEGKVTVAFNVEADSSVTNIRVVKGLTKETDAEAIRLIKESAKKWIPAMSNGVPGKSECTVPINFTLHKS